MLLQLLILLLLLIAIKYVRMEPQTDQKQFLSIDDPRLNTHYVYIKTFALIDNKSIPFVLSTSRPVNSPNRILTFKKLKENETIEPRFIRFIVEKTKDDWYLKSENGLYVHINEKDPLKTTGNFLKSTKPNSTISFEKVGDTVKGPKYKLFNRNVYFELSVSIPEQYLSKDNDEKEQK